MPEYQIRASLNGRFLFRTEWDDDSLRVKNTYNLLQSELAPAVTLSISRRCPIVVEITDEFGCQQV